MTNTPRPRIPGRGQYSESARLERLDFLRDQTGAPLPTQQTTGLAPDRLVGNVENLVGSVEIPVGLAGPLTFDGEHIEGTGYAPIATVEGSLVASICRGAAAVSRSGGVKTRVLGQRMVRVPCFLFGDLDSAIRFSRWTTAQFDAFRAQARMVSQHARLIEVRPTVLGRWVHVRFVYETGDAAGQNMTTACTWHASQWILDEIEAMGDLALITYYVDGNLSGDKKVTFDSLISGRGTRVIAEAQLDAATIEAVLKLSVDDLVRGYHAGMTGAVHTGMVGYNVNLANVIAGVFAATGQDIGCVHESAIGHFYLERTPEGVYLSTLLPSLIIGTVGGGTGLPRQTEWLQMMGCAGPHKVKRLAEIIAGFCLCLDVSTMAALANGQFAVAHERLGRNRPVDWLRADELSPSFFTERLREQTGDAALVVKTVEVIEVPMAPSIVSEMTSHRVKKLVGHLPRRLRWTEGGGATVTRDVVVKVKPIDREVIHTASTVAGLCGPALAAAHRRAQQGTGFAGCHERELAVYQSTDPRFTDHMPRVYGVHRDPERETYLVILERLEGMALMDSADDPSGWTPAHVDAAIRGMGAFHAVWYGREAALQAEPWLVAPPSTAARVGMLELWSALAMHAQVEFPEWVSREDARLHGRLLATLPEWWSRIEALPRTLVHNDFHPRNLCLRPDGDGWRLCAYDWELATLHLPQRDLAELLMFVLPPDALDADQLTAYLALHRRELARQAACEVDAEGWRLGFELALCDLLVTRIPYYLMSHTFRDYPFMERILTTCRRLIPLAASIDAARL